MNRTLAIVLAAFILVASAGAAFAGGQKDGGTAPAASGAPMPISMVVMGGPKTPNSTVQKALEAKYNVKLDLLFMPAWNEKNVKLNLLMSDPKTMPDVIQWEGMDKEFKEWVAAGLIVDMLPYLKKSGSSILNYYSKDTLFYSYDNGKVFKLPGDVAEASTGTILMRGDWLKKLKLTAPTTIDEFRKVLIAFTRDDPDGNNADDTYGFSGAAQNRLGAFGAIFAAYGVDPNAFLTTADGTIKWGAVIPQAKEALKMIRQLYVDGVLDPTMLTGNDDIERWTSGKVGAMSHGIHHFNPGSVLNKGFYANNPGGEMISVDPIKGPTGFASTDVQSVAGWCYISVTSHAKDPARVVAFLNSLNTPEGFRLYKFGVEGKHYSYDNGVFKPLMPQDQLNAEGVNLLTWYLERKDENNIVNTPQVIQMYKRNLTLYLPMKKIKVEFKDKNRPAWAEYSGDLNTLRDTVFYDIIQGRRDISAFDDFVKQWYAQGGTAVEKEANELFGKQRADLAAFDKIYSSLK